MDFPFPFFQLQFDKNGKVFAPAEAEALMAGLTTPADKPTDLLVMCHGWNNNMDDAKTLYSGLAKEIAAQALTLAALAKRSFAIAGVLWPSKKFEDEELIPSGAASLDEAVTSETLKERVRDLRSLYEAADWPSGGENDKAEVFDRIEALMEGIEEDPARQAEAASLVRSLVSPEGASADDASDRFFEMKPSMLVEKLSRSLNPPVASSPGAALSVDPFSTGITSGLGGAASFRDVVGGIKSGFLHLLNFTTYYLMKARAGEVGAKGVAPLLEKIREVRPELRLHLIGHSFGCRLASAAVNALPENPAVYPDTMLLLQGAFSHNGFAAPGDEVPEGVFRSVVSKGKVRGPILITHTRNDKAVGLAYPIASRLVGVTAAAIGDENDVFGGLGSNGAQTEATTKERVTGDLLGVGGAYPFATAPKPSTPYNLRADAFIGGHSDIVKPEVGYAQAVAMAAT
jgi:pimeloyl-ACP methyl ester carboxylesterase